MKAVFERGNSFKAFPMRMVLVPWQHQDNVVVKAGFSVPKRRFKRAVDRNRIKRQMREAYRLNKSEYLTNLQHTYAVVFIYIPSAFSDYQSIEKGMKKGLKQLANFDGNNESDK